MQLKNLKKLLLQAVTSLHSDPPDFELNIANLLQALEQNGERSVDDLVSIIEKKWPKPKALRTKKPLSSTTFDSTTWISKLEQARKDPAAFQALLHELLKTKEVKLANVAAIANDFRSTTKSYKSKTAAVDDIRKAWLEAQRDAVKVQSSGDIF